MGPTTMWRDVCAEDDILMLTGACALVGGRQVAVFRTPEGFFAIDNHDPVGRANVLSRGIVGDPKGHLVVASPLYKQHFDLRTGACLEDDTIRVDTWRVTVEQGRVLVAMQPRAARRPARRRRLVLIGNGMAGMRALEELLALAPGRYEITVFGAEARGGYNRVALSSVLAGEKTVADIAGPDAAWYASRGIELRAGDPVVRIDRACRTVTSRSGFSCAYDRLLLATGSSPVALGVPGEEIPGVVAFRNLDDVEAMLEAAGRGGRAVVVGGGLLGVEAAAGLRARGMGATLVHIRHTLMDRQLDAEAGDLLRASLEAKGIRLVLGATTTRVLGEDRAAGVALQDGRELAADLVVTAVGIRPNVELAAKSGIQCGRGILVDDTLQTFDPRIWAVGECVQHRRATFGLVAPLWEQARVCAVHLAELGTARYRAPLPSAHLKVSGVSVFSAGELDGDARDESIVLRDPARGVYKRIVLRDGRVRGALLYGDTTDGSWYFDMMQGGTDVSALRDALAFGPTAQSGQPAAR